MLRRPLSVAALAAGALLAGALPTLAADSGAVQATVVAQAPAEACLTVSQNSLDFGSNDFSTPASETVVSEPATPYTLTSCSTDDQAFLGRTSDATGATATWTPQDPVEDGNLGTDICSIGPNRFRVSTIIGGSSGTFLDGTNEALAGAGRNGTDNVTAGDTRGVENSLVVPCETSDGAGETMGFVLTYTAVLVG